MGAVAFTDFNFGMYCDAIDIPFNQKFMILRYYLRSADENGHSGHPQIEMEKMGFKVLGAIPETIADLWFFEVEKPDFDIPKWIDVMTDSVKDLPEWGLRVKY